MKRNISFSIFNYKIITLFTVIGIILNCLYILVFVSNNVIYGESLGEDSIPPNNGNWIIDSSGNIIINETIILNGDLIIKNGGSLIFKNVTFLMNCTSNGTYNIEVESGGEFRIYDYDDDPLTRSDSSIITSAISDGRHRFHFYIKKYSNFIMKNSDLHECGYLTFEPFLYWTQGLCIETNNTYIENCIISDNFNGIMLYQFASNNFILNTSVLYNWGKGIDLDGDAYGYTTSNNIIANCIISTNQGYTPGVGFSLSKTKNMQIINCKIYNHEHGISIGNSKNINISNCEILNNHNSIYVSALNSNITIFNNTLAGNFIKAITNTGTNVIDAQNNYFGTNNKELISSFVSGKINYSNWLFYKNNDILLINNSEEWNNKIKHLNHGLIIKGNLSINNSTIILNSNIGKNFIQVEGNLNIDNSTIKINESTPSHHSNWGSFVFHYLIKSTGRIKNSIIEDQKGLGIGSDNFIISNSEFKRNISKSPKYGLLLNGNHTIIVNCNISGNYIGIEINSGNNTIKKCNIDLNNRGINLKNNNNEIYDCKFFNNSAVGIRLSHTKFSNIKNSSFINSGNGIYFWESSNNTISNCNFNYNRYNGIALLKGAITKPSKYNRIFNNNFISNGFEDGNYYNAIDMWSDNIWDNGYPGGGNYWSNYNGIDLYSGENQDIMGSDGFGDLPKFIDGKSDNKPKDNYPLLYPFEIKYNISSPALKSVPSPNPNGNFTLSWTKVQNATNYTVYEEKNDNLDLFELGPVTNLNISKRQIGTYHYYIQALNNKAVSKKSNTITIVVDYPPDIPRNFTVKPIPEGNAINIFWSPNKDDVINYTIWSNFTGYWNPLINISHPNCSYIHSGLDEGMKYFYKMRVWDSINQSSKFSKIIEGIPKDSKPPLAPLGLKAYAISNNTISLRWVQNNETDLVGYEIYRREHFENNYTQIDLKPVLNNSYLDINLKSNTTYFYKIKAFDEVPNYSNFSNEASNTTRKMPPCIILYSPVGSNVTLDTNIVVTFNNPMNQFSVENAFLIRPPISGNFIWDSDSRIINFILNEYLIENETYNITILSIAEDLEKESLSNTFSWEFTTTNLQFPKIISYSPLGTFVSTDTNISITFNLKMDKSSVERAFSIEPAINGTLQWLNDDLTIVFIPDNELLELTEYFIVINRSAHDQQEITLFSSFSWNFTTGDFTSPKIISYTPTGNDIAIETIITIIFNEPMNKSSIIEGFSIIPEIEGEFHWRNNSVVFEPSHKLSYKTTYQIIIENSATDIWGNLLSENGTWKFTTEKEQVEHQDQNYIFKTILYIGIGCIIFTLILIFISVKLKRKKLISIEKNNDKLNFTPKPQSQQEKENVKTPNDPQLTSAITTQTIPEPETMQTDTDVQASLPSSDAQSPSTSALTPSVKIPINTKDI